MDKKQPLCQEEAAFCYRFFFRSFAFLVLISLDAGCFLIHFTNFASCGHAEALQCLTAWPQSPDSCIRHGSAYGREYKASRSAGRCRLLPSVSGGVLSAGHCRPHSSQCPTVCLGTAQSLPLHQFKRHLCSPSARFGRMNDEFFRKPRTQFLHMADHAD